MLLIKLVASHNLHVRFCLKVAGLSDRYRSAVAGLARILMKTIRKKPKADRWGEYLLGEKSMIEQFYFKNFKSYKNAELTMKQFVTLIGANASGKSNAIEGIQILSELAKGIELGSIMDGGQGNKYGIRGGAQGSKRFKTNSFKLGAKISVDQDLQYMYEITIGVNGQIHIDEEALYLINGETVEKKNQIIFKTQSAIKGSSEIAVNYKNVGGNNIEINCVRNVSILSRIPRDSESERKRVAEIERVTNSLRKILVLSPDPTQMRDYNRITDTALKMDASNISAVLNELCKNSEKKSRILDFMRRLPENEIQDISFIKTSIGDVIFALKEKYMTSTELVDAKKLSDGTLRCIAIIASLLLAEEDSIVIIEEADNGIHPSRLRALISELQEISEQNKFDVIITTHNSGFLDMYNGSLIEGVNYVYRDSDEGVSKIVPIANIDGVYGILASEGLGDSLVSQKLMKAAKQELEEPDYTWMEV